MWKVLGATVIAVTVGCGGSGSGGGPPRSAGDGGGTAADAGRTLDAGTVGDGGTQVPDGGTGTDGGTVGPDGGTLACTGPQTPPGAETCAALPELSNPWRSPVITADAGCVTTFTDPVPRDDSVFRSSLVPSNGAGQIVVVSPFRREFNLIGTTVTVLQPDGGVGPSGFGGLPIWPLERSWLTGLYSFNPHTLEAASFSLYRTEGSWPSPAFETRVLDGTHPFFLAPAAQGGLAAIYETFVENVCPADAGVGNFPLSATVFSPSGEPTTTEAFTCAGNSEPKVVVATSAAGQSLAYVGPRGSSPSELWRIAHDGTARRAEVPLQDPVEQILPLVDGRFAVGTRDRWLGVLGASDAWEPPPCWLVPRLGQDLRALPSGSGYWRQEVDPHLDSGCETRIEELGANGASCRTYDVGQFSGGQCTSRPMVRGVDGTVAQLTERCEVLVWPKARP